MRNIQGALALSFVLSLVFDCSAHAQQSVKNWMKRPKLIVVVVIDQCRSDFLTRYEKKLAQSRGGGIQFLMSKGAYFPFARYDVLQSMTCPGHATILTGAYPYQMGIPINEWYDTAKKSEVYCASDSNSPLVGIASAPEDGVSPTRLVGSTVGDELKVAGLGRQVVAVALKDRSAIMLGGHRADLAIWVEKAQWVTSKYYRPEGTLPDWVNKLNVDVKSTIQARNWSSKVLEKGPDNPFSSGFGVESTTRAAIAALNSMKLGHNGGTDILAVSYSSHDMLGHEVGLSSAKMEDLTLQENSSIGELIRAVEKSVGAQNVVFAFTGDHGVAPPVEALKAQGVPAGVLDTKAIVDELNEHLESKFGKSEKGKWVLKARSFNFYLNPEAIADRKRSRAEVELEAKLRILYLAGNSAGNPSGTASVARDGVAYVFTRTEWENRRLPPGQFERQIMRTYIPGKSGDLILIPKPFWVEKGAFATHMTSYSYDASVPLILAGPRIKPGVYAERAEVVDLAPTLSYISGAVPPSGSEGRVLSEIFY